MEDSQVVLQALSALTGIDQSDVEASVETIACGFADARAAVDRLISSPDDLRHELSKNLLAYTDWEPYEEAVFLYFDLASSVELQQYVASIRLAVADTLGESCDLRLTDPRQQHCTAFVEMARTPLGDLESLIEQTGTKYAEYLASQRPFLLWVCGPHLLPGGIVLECTVSCTTVALLRARARADERFVPEKASRRIHNLLHSTVAYIADASPERLLKLKSVLDDLRIHSHAIPIRVQEARILGTRNRRLTGNMVVVRLLGRYPFQDRSSGAELIRQLLCDAEVLARNPVLARRIVETALDWSEQQTELNGLRLADQLLTASLPFSIRMTASSTER